MSFAPENESLAKPETLLRVPVGLASPLWGLFAGAAVSGAAWWWMTRWTRPQNLEAMFGAEAPEAAALAAPTIGVIEAGETALEAMIEPDVAELAASTVTAAEAADTALEAAAEPAAQGLETTSDTIAEVMTEAAPEPLIEATAEPMAETVGAALIDAPQPVEAVGGESAPISPVIEALAPETAAELAPTPKLKKAKAPKSA
jgi:hypothetical protein